MLEQPLQSKSTQKTLILLSFLMLSSAMLLWPEFYLFSKSIKIPAWASYLPYPIYTGVCLATVSLLPVAWGTTRLGQAIKATFLVALTAPVIPIFVKALLDGQTDYLWYGALFNYVFILGISLGAPVVALLLLRWAWCMVRRLK